MVRNAGGRSVDRGAISEAARHASALHQWLTRPDFDEEGEVQQAEAHIAGFAGRGETPLLAAAIATHAWLEAGGARPPIPAGAALRPETPWEAEVRVPAFLRALAAEAEDGRKRQLIDTLPARERRVEYGRHGRFGEHDVC